MNNILAITYAFLLAYCPYDQYGIGYKTEIYDNTTHVQFELGLKLFDMVNIYAGEETYQYPSGSILDWQPYTQAYWIGAECEFDFSKKFNVKTGIKHLCQHPVDCWNSQPSDYNRAYTEIYMQVYGKINIF